jgi:hypothetical protein
MTRKGCSTLALVGRIAPDFSLLAGQQIGQASRIVNVRRSRSNVMDEFRSAVDANVRFHPELPLIALLRLMHVRITRFILVLRRRRCVDDRGIDNGAFTDFDPVRLKVLKDGLEQGLTEIVSFEQVPEAADRGFGNC